MGTHYRQMSFEDRCQIAQLHSQGRSIRSIAAAMDRAPSTIARELKRNGGRKVGYKPAAGQAGEPVISHETIYRFIHAQLARTQNFRWRHYLPRAKAKRGFRGRRGGSAARLIQARRPTEERPQSAADRASPGHWEADLMLFAKYGQVVLALHERTSRIIIATRPPGKAAIPIAEILTQLLAPLPPDMRQTIAFDNGTEFARHHQLHRLHLQTFFSDPHAPWQKGGIENAIGRMRRFMPRKTDLDTLTQQRFNELLCAYNNTPRKCLAYKTPTELFLNQLLHFKCESTPQPSLAWRGWVKQNG